MSDKLYSLSIEKLLTWILNEEKSGFVLGIPKELIFNPEKNKIFEMERYGEKLETPLGVAAGPHTQMAQNIVAAWLVGSRYIELKTVQTLDELEVTKPCIDMADEGYNCEWSQELKIDNSFDEYLNAWIILHILRDKFFGSADERGFIFNMSVGYDLQGIMKPNVQKFLDKMTDAGKELAEKIERAAKIYPRVKDLNIPAQISNSVTLSTMHGCPPDEIESIANYLIEERKLNTAIKLNPTLLGAEKLREILNEKLGYETVVPDEAFAHDLKFDDAVGIIERLTEKAKANNVEFGLKLTNTLESLNETKFLPKQEKMVYMSGRALHPISINLAAKLQNHFNGELDISFSAGIDAFNVAEALKCNIKPVTVCSDLLKPGGYARMAQYFEEIEKAMRSTNAENLEQYVLGKSPGKRDLKEAALANLNEYAGKTVQEKRNKKEFFKYDTIKTGRELTVYDCVYAPCTETCAVSQDVPEYMWHTANGDYKKAFEAIVKANPLPNVTGMVCDHLCQTKCTRMNYDNTLLIREIKRFIAEKEADNFELQPKEPNGVKIAIIGAGPSGLSAAYFLALEGCDVEVFEANDFAGGMAAGAIPVFRLKYGNLQKDVENIKSLGVRFNFNYEITKEKFNGILSEYDYVYIGVGARKGKKLEIEGEDLNGVFDQLEFLAKVKENPELRIGEKVAVIGGGNSAMDAARTAKRLAGEKGEVILLYRRTIKEMPADKEEVEALIEEGIEIIELAAPEKIIEKDGKLALVSSRMKLGEKDASGRARPVKIDNSEFELLFDAVITAIGQETVLDFYPFDRLEIDEATLETQIENVFAGGDAVRGADSLINAISDGQKTAKIIAERFGRKLNISVEREQKFTKAEQRKKAAYRKFGVQLPVIPVEQRNSFEMVHPTLTEEQAREEAARCLYCSDICDVCVTVCPNLANLSVDTKPFEVSYPVIEIAGESFNVVARKTFRVEQVHQIVNIGDFCNECGNCNTFCPTSGAPYKTKPKFYLNDYAFEQEDNCYRIVGNKIEFKNGDDRISLSFENGIAKLQSGGFSAKIRTGNFEVMEINAKGTGRYDFGKAAEMIYLYENLQNLPMFKNN